MKDLTLHIRELPALGVIAVSVGILFFRFFWPEPGLLVTPDFGRSDAWHFSFATKWALAESLSRGQLPLWEPRMGMGFPLFAEGQVGALFLPNTILMALPALFGVSPVTAYNATYVVLFLTMGWGMYAWLRVIGCSRGTSIWGAITLLLSGQTIPRLAHQTLLQSLSMSPILLALAHQAMTKRNVLWISLFALTLSQQFFTGSPQPVGITLLAIGIYLVCMTYVRGIGSFRSLSGRLAIGVVLSVGISAVQLFPSAEMLSQSTSPAGFSPEEASFYSFPAVHLKTLIAPFILGNPKNGTYPPFTAFDGSIFWENTLYIGWLPILLFALGFIRLRLAKKDDVLGKFFVATLLVSFLLMLGKYSPLYLAYSVWPLNFFRVPSRFAWIFLLTIVTAVSYTLSAFITQKRTRVYRRSRYVLIIVILTLQTYQLMTTWWNYHAIEPARMWLTQTPFLQAIDGPIRTIGSERVHNGQFLKNGWGANTDVYRFLRNAPSPNSNLYWNMTQTDLYAGRFLKRQALAEALLGNEIKADGQIATISARGRRLLDLYHASSIVSALRLDINPPLPVAADTVENGRTILAYRNSATLPRAYLATQTVFTPTISKTSELLADPSFIPGTSVLIHDQALTLSTQNPTQGDSVTIVEDNPTRVTMTAEVKTPQAVLVFGDTYYPGWIASVDARETPVYPVNIKERGILLTKGTHTITWTYQPLSFSRGLRLTLISLGFTLLFPVVYPLSVLLIRKYA